MRHTGHRSAILLMPEQELLQGAQLMLYPYLHITIQHSFNTKLLLNGRWADYYKSEGLVRG